MEHFLVEGGDEPIGPLKSMKLKVFYFSVCE